MLRHSFENKKKKIKTKAIAEPSQDTEGPAAVRQYGQEDPLMNQSKLSAETLKKGLQQIAAALDEEKEARAQLEQKILSLYKRNMSRENQFRKIVQETIPHCKEKASIEVRSLQAIHDTILNFFDENNKKIEEQLEEEGKVLEGVMDRKIRNLTNHMETELYKAQKKLKMNYETISKEIRAMIRLSSSILDQNDGFRKRISELLLKNQILKSQKQLLIAQTLEKKELILKLHKKLKDKYEKDEVVETEIRLLKKQRRQVEQQYLQYEKQIRFKMDNQQGNRAKSIQVFQIDDFGFKIDHSKKGSSAKKYSDIPQSRQSTIGTRPLHSKQEPRRVMTTEGKRQRSSKNNFNPNRTQTIASELFENRPPAQPTITELRQIIRSERRKNSELKKKVNQYQVLQQEMNSLFQDLLEVDRETVIQKKIEDDCTWKLVKNSGKIYQMVKELERRLLSSANPVVNSGYNDLDNLLNESKEEPCP